MRRKSAVAAPGGGVPKLHSIEAVRSVYYRRVGWRGGRAMSPESLTILSAFSAVT